MDGKTTDELRRDEEIEGTREAAASARAEAIQRDLHTAMPGIVDSYDPATQTAVVQPAIKRLFIGQEPMDLPLCVDVPVIFPGGGPFTLTFPLVKGDEGLLLFSERAIDFWFEKGKTQEPSELRFHDLSDAFFLAGVQSKPRFLGSVSTSAIELRGRDPAGPKISLSTSKVSLGKGTKQKSLKGEETVAQIKLITVPTGMGPSGVPINASAFDPCLSNDVENS